MIVLQNRKKAYGDRTDQRALTVLENTEEDLKNCEKELDALMSK